MNRSLPFVLMALVVTPASMAVSADSDYSDAVKLKQQIEQATGGQSPPSGKSRTTASNQLHLDAPLRKAGWWEFSAVSDSGTAIGKQSLCIGNRSENVYSAFDQIITTEAVTGTPCEKRDFQKSAGGWVFETKCSPMDLPDLSTTTKGTISGDIATKYEVHLTATSSDDTRAGVIHATWKGACPAGRQEGDLVDEKGALLFNMIDLVDDEDL